MKSHSLRHFRYTHLQKCEVHPAIHNYWIGHAMKGAMAEIYGYLETDIELYANELSAKLDSGFRLPPCRSLGNRVRSRVGDSVMRFQFNDGGRKAAGFRGTTGECVVRSVAVATGLPKSNRSRWRKRRGSTGRIQRSGTKPILTLTGLVTEGTRSRFWQRTANNSQALTDAGSIQLTGSAPPRLTRTIKYLVDRIFRRRYHPYLLIP